jgi:hypothetical protein
MQPDAAFVGQVRAAQLLVKNPRRPRLTHACLGQRFAVAASNCLRHHGRRAAQKKPGKGEGKQCTEADEQIAAGLRHAGIRELTGFYKVTSFGQAGL